LKDKFYAIGLVIAVTGLAYIVSFLSPVFDPLVVGILLGIFLANLFEGKKVIEEASVGIKIFLPIGIALYGFQLQIRNHVPDTELLGLIGVFVVLYILTYLIARVSRLNERISTLLATGISICGASAIAVISPAIDAEKKETSIAVLAVMTTGLFWSIIYPMIQGIFPLNSQEFGFLAGSTLPMLGLVKVTAIQAGEKSLQVALQLKFLRISSLFFMVTIAILLSGIRHKMFKVPIFMWFFIVFAFLTNFMEVPKGVMQMSSEISKLFLTATLSAIGLNTSFEAITEEGLKPFFVTFLALSVVTIIILLVLI